MTLAPARQEHQRSEGKVDELQFRQHDRQQVEHKLVVDRDVVRRLVRTVRPDGYVVEKRRQTKQEVDPQHGQAEGDVPSQQAVVSGVGVDQSIPLGPFPTAQAAKEVRQRRNGEQEDRRNESDQPPERDLPEL
jgi:hypothetical protein